MSSSVGIRPIKIRFTTNINGQESILTRSILQQDSSSSSSYELSNYPYFTDSVRFPVAKILQKSNNERIDIFFNDTLFRNTIGHVSNVDVNTRNTNAEYNVNALLKLLLPTTFPSINNLHDSFSENIKRIPQINVNVADSGGFFSHFTNLFSKGKGLYSYLNLNNATYTVTKITLLNDIINDSAFLPLIRSGSAFSTWRKSTVESLNKDVVNIRSNLTQLIQDKLPRIQQLFLDQTSDVYEAYKKAKMAGIPQNKLAHVPSYLIIEFLDELIRLDLKSESHVTDTMNLFSEIYNLKSRAERSNYIPYAIENLDGFSDMMSRSAELKVKTQLHKLLNEMTDIYKLLDPNSKEDAKLFSGTKKKVFDQVKRYDKIAEFLAIIERYNKKARHYSNPLLIDILNASKTDNIEFIKFFEFVNSLRVEGYAPSPELFQQRDMIERLRTGVMTVFDKVDEKSKEKDLAMEISASYDILINIEVIEGVLNDENIQDVKCSFRDRNAITTYNENKYAGQKNPVIFYNNNTPFVMANHKKETKSKSMKRTSKGGKNITAKKRGGYPSQRPTPPTKKTNRRSKRSKNTTPMFSLR